MSNEELANDVPDDAPSEASSDSCVQPEKDALLNAPATDDKSVTHDELKPDDEIHLGEVVNRIPRHCPKCRSFMIHPQGPCKHCGWSHIGTTELVFVDQSFPCPTCGSERKSLLQPCITCGSDDVLKEQRAGTSYSIATLLAATAIVASCVGIIKVVPALGIPVTLILLFTSMRTTVLTARRKKFGYRVSTRVGWTLFGQSLGAVFLASIAAVVTMGLIGSITFAITDAWYGAPGAATGLILPALPVIATLVILLERWRQATPRNACLVGMLQAQIFAVPTLFLPTNSWRFEVFVYPWILLGCIVLLAVTTLRYIVLHSRPRTVLLHLSGMYSGIFVCGVVALPFTDPERVAIVIVSSCVGFSGVFIAGLILVNLWKYDDAFDVTA